MGATPLIESVSPRTRQFKQCSIHYTTTAPVYHVFPPILLTLYCAMANSILHISFFTHHVLYFPSTSLYILTPYFILHTFLHTPYATYLFFPTLSSPYQYSFLVPFKKTKTPHYSCVVILYSPFIPQLTTY